MRELYILLFVSMLFITVFALCTYMHYPKQTINDMLKNDIMKYGLVHFTRSCCLESICKFGLNPLFGKPMSIFEKNFIWFFIDYPDKRKNYIKWIKNNNPRSDCDTVIVFNNIKLDHISKMKFHEKKGTIVYSGIMRIDDALIFSLDEYSKIGFDDSAY